MRTFRGLIRASSLEELATIDICRMDVQARGARQAEDGKYEVPAVLTEAQGEELEVEGLEVRVGLFLEDIAEERLQEVSRVDRFSEMSEEELFSEGMTSKYMNVAEIESCLQQVAREKPDLVQLVRLPERTHDKQICHAVRIGRVRNRRRPSVLFTGGVHAREWGTSDICISFIRRLLGAYSSQRPFLVGRCKFEFEWVRRVVEEVEVLVFPDVNPDGKAYSQKRDPREVNKHVWWRMNRNPNKDVGLNSPPGVDINRNFDFLWAHGIGSCPRPGKPGKHQLYRGRKAFSEPESRNVKFLLDQYPIRLYMDIHGDIGQILYPWGDDEIGTNRDMNFRNPAWDGKRGRSKDAYKEYLLPADKKMFNDLGCHMQSSIDMVRGTVYEPSPSYSGAYPTSATSDDYAYSRHIVDRNWPKVYAYTFEFRASHFAPPIREMAGVIDDVNAGMMEFCCSAAQMSPTTEDAQELKAVAVTD